MLHFFLSWPYIWYSLPDGMEYYGLSWIQKCCTQSSESSNLSLVTLVFMTELFSGSFDLLSGNGSTTPKIYVTVLMNRIAALKEAVKLRA